MTINQIIAKQGINGILIKKDGKFQGATNFNAKILEEVILQGLNGQTERIILLEVKINGKRSKFHVPYQQFKDGTWVGDHLGLDAEVDYSIIKKGVLSSVINKLSNKKIKKIKFQRLGFYKHEGEMYFLHVGGALSANGSNNPLLMAQVEGTLRKCNIPLLSSEDNLPELIRKFLELSEIAINNPLIGTLLLAGITRALLIGLKPNNVVIFFIGKTGCRKTAAALIGQACFGAGFKEPPASWTSTAKSTELTVLEAVTTLVLIDDYTLAHESAETKKLAEYIIGGVSNSSVRGFAMSSTKNANTPIIKAMPLMTAESIPELIPSRKQRCIFVSFMNTDVDNTMLTQYQKNAAGGDYVKVIGQYIVYLLRTYEQIGMEISGKFARYRTQAAKKLGEGLHARAPSNYVDLMLGFHYFLKFCITDGHLKEQEATEIKSYHSANLIKLLKQQPALHETNDIKSLVKDKMVSYLQEGKFIFLELNERMSDGIKGGKYPEKFVGWEDYDNQILYVLSDRANLITKNLPDELQTIMAGGVKSFWSNMNRFGLLVETNVAGKKNTVRKTINGELVSVYSLDYSLLYHNK